MPQPKKVPLAVYESDSENASSDEDSSSGEDDGRRVQDHSETEDEYEYDVRKERMEALSKATAGNGRRNASEKDFVRQIPASMTLTTAQQRTRMTMFGITNTELTHIFVIDPVLYIALYDTGDASSEVDDLHWGFIVGPSDEKSDSKGLLYNMEPRRTREYNRPFVSEWRWLYNQPTVPLRGQYNLLARLMIAEVTDMKMLQEIMLRWGEGISMRDHVEWMSEKWVKNILKSLDEETRCLGRRMDSFQGVEAEGRWLAETEKEKRKGFCLLNTRPSTRTLFERERATALSSTATVDVAIKYPILYVAVYLSDRSPRQYHWAFLIGPSKEAAESEGVYCGMKVELDSNGWPHLNYTQIIVPLRGEDDLLVRMLVAEIVDLGPLGEILHDQDLTPTTERTDSMLWDSKGNSLAWVVEKLKMLDRKPECFAYKCHDLNLCEYVGRKYARDAYNKRKKAVRPFGVQVETRNLVWNWEEPADDETNVVIRLDLKGGRPNTISRAIQIVTGVLGAAAVAVREKRGLGAEREAAASDDSGTSQNLSALAEETKSQDLDETTKTTKSEVAPEVMAQSESTQITTDEFYLNKPKRAFEKMIAKEDEKGGDRSEDDENGDEEEEEFEEDGLEEDEEGEREDEDEEEDEEQGEDEEEDDEEDGEEGEDEEQGEEEYKEDRFDEEEQVREQGGEVEEEEGDRDREEEEEKEGEEEEEEEEEGGEEEEEEGGEEEEEEEEEERGGGEGARGAAAVRGGRGGEAAAGGGRDDSDQDEESSDEAEEEEEDRYEEDDKDSDEIEEDSDEDEEPSGFQTVRNISLVKL